MSILILIRDFKGVAAQAYVSSYPVSTWLHSLCEMPLALSINLFNKAGNVHCERPSLIVCRPCRVPLIFSMSKVIHRSYRGN